MKRAFRILVHIFLLSTIVSCGTPPEKTETKEEVQEEIEVRIKGMEVSYSTDSTEMKGYIAYDEALEGKRPGILIVHEWWGHTEHVRKRADMLAELGYVALALDMYGDGKTADHPDDAGKFARMVFQNMPEAQARFDAAYALLEAHPQTQDGDISAMGYCFGGSVVLTMANAGKELDGVAAFHSGVQVPIPPGDDLSAKVLVINGAADPFISAESVASFKAQMDSVNADYDYIDYPGVMHAYTNPAATELGKKFDLPLAYNKEADEKSWTRFQEFLNEVYPGTNN